MLRVQQLLWGHSMSSSAVNHKTNLEYAVAMAQHSRGEPVGASIYKEGRFLCCEDSTVLLTNDPTATAEINAIRMACSMLGRYDLYDCVLYSSRKPCPMCDEVIKACNIKEVHYPS